MQMRHQALFRCDERHQVLVRFDGIDRREAQPFKVRDMAQHLREKACPAGAFPADPDRMK